MDWEQYENIAKQVKELKKDHNSNTQQEPLKDIHGDCDYVWAPEKWTSTMIYIFVMIFGSIFNARILIWIVVTLVYSNFIDNKK